MERFRISEKIERRAATFLNDNLADVKLPEDMNFVTPEEAANAQKPFVVITFKPTTDEALKCYTAGAMRYVTMTFSTEQLKDALEGTKSQKR